MIGILSALGFELAPLLDRLENKTSETISHIEFVSGQLNGRPVVGAVSGVGKVNAARCAQIMICRYNVEMIVNAGVGGSLCKGLGLGDLAVAESCVQYDMDMAAAGTPLGVIPWGKVSKEFPDGDQATAYLPCDSAMADCLEKAGEEAGIHCKRGVIATGDRFVADKKLNDFLRDTFHAISCEMEGGAVAQVCRAADIRCAVLRAISDNADEDAAETYNGQKTLCATIPVVCRALELYFS